MSRGTSVLRRVFVLTYNGSPIAYHASREDAELAADMLHVSLGTALTCFDVREVWR
jgi:hypothetical protein